MTSMTGLDCVVMCNLIHAHTRTRTDDVMWEVWYTWPEGGKAVDNKVLVQYMATHKISRVERKKRGKSKALRASVRTVDTVCSLCRV